MESFTILLQSYFQVHKHPLNKTLHCVGTPCVLFSTILFFSWIHITMPGVFDLHTSWLVAIALSVYYFRLDSQLGFVFALVMVPIVIFANLFSFVWVSFFLFCILFAIGFILKLVGHVIEGQQPAFISNPKLLLMAPLFVMLEVAFKRGYRQDLQLLVWESQDPLDMFHTKITEFD